MSQRPIVLKLNGKRLDLNPPSPRKAAVIAFLEKAPPDELFDAAELGKQIKISVSNIRSTLGTDPDFAAYTVMVGRDRYWGSRKAIAELRRQVGL